MTRYVFCDESETVVEVIVADAYTSPVIPARPGWGLSILPDDSLVDVGWTHVEDDWEPPPGWVPPAPPDPITPIPPPPVPDDALTALQTRCDGLQEQVDELILASLG